MANPANIRETKIALGKKRQADAVTASLVAAMWNLSKLNPDIPLSNLITENDAAELGKGDEFVNTVFKTYRDFAGSLEKYTSSEWFAWVMCFSLGDVTESGDGTPEVYTVIPQDPTDGIELPYFTSVLQIRDGAIVDRKDIGCMVTGWKLNILSGPGRASCKLTADFVGIGKFTDPSSITIPSPTTEHLLSSATLALTMNSVDYVTTRKIQTLEATWNNSPRLDRRFYPGSGSQSGAAIGGRIEFGDRVPTFKFTADFEEDSTELSTLEAGTEFTAVLSLTLDANNSGTMTYQRLRFSEVKVTNTNGIVTVDATCEVMKHPSNGVLTVVANTETTDICAIP